ncbi:MAG: hypothetical protein K6F46_06515 [Desulfovibrio sp.]|nr:hypothetical protein [Desulfovibrio sp.]
MKKLLRSLLFVAVLMLASSVAMAAVQTYDTKIGKFTVDVPDGWKSEAISDGCKINSADGKNSMSVQFVPGNGIAAMDMAKRMAEAMNVKVTSEKAENDAAFLEGLVDGQPFSALVVKEGNILNGAIFGGPEQDAMKKIYGTVKDASASATTQVFGPDFARFKVDVPAGWKASPNQGGCQIDSPDETSSLSIQVQKAGGKSAADFAAEIAKNLPYKVLKIEKEDDSQSIIYAEPEKGVRMAIMCMVSEDKFLAVTMAGRDTDTMKSILDSLNDAQ